jgi:hypothetical protein
VMGYGIHHKGTPGNFFGVLISCLIVVVNTQLHSFVKDQWIALYLSKGFITMCKLYCIKLTFLKREEILTHAKHR